MEIKSKQTHTTNLKMENLWKRRSNKTSKHGAEQTKEKNISTTMTWNPVTGCNRGCSYCYARGIARRFGGQIGGHNIKANPMLHDIPQPLAVIRKGRKIVKAPSGTLYLHAASGGYVLGGSSPGELPYADSDLLAIREKPKVSSVTWKNRGKIPVYGYGHGFMIRPSNNTYQWLTFKSSVESEKGDFVTNVASYGFRIGDQPVLNLTYHTANSNYKPYLTLTYEDDADDCGLQAIPTYPKNGAFCDQRNGVKVQWEHTLLPHTIGTIESDIQTKAVITWTYDSITETATIDGSDTSYTNLMVFFSEFDERLLRFYCISTAAILFHILQFPHWQIFLERINCPRNGGNYGNKKNTDKLADTRNKTIHYFCTYRSP